MSWRIDPVVPKIRTNTARWSAGVGQFWTSRDEMEGYLWLRGHLKPGTRVFAYINSFFLIGFDMYNDFWTPGYQASLMDLFDQDPDRTYAALKDNRYDYLIIGKRERNFFGKGKFDRKILDLSGHPAFALLFTRNNDVWVFKLK